MEKRMLGNIAVGAMGLGCMDFSHGHGNPPPREESIRLMRLAYEKGVTLLTQRTLTPTATTRSWSAQP